MIKLIPTRYDVYIVVRDDNAFNVMNKNGHVLYDDWFKFIGDFYDGFADVQSADGKWNFIDTNGALLSKEWFDMVGGFSSGFVPVKKNGLGWNFLSHKGEITLKEWFDDVWRLYQGEAHVVKNGESFYVNMCGEHYDESLYSSWFKYIYKKF